jgi:hypothetical protein
MMTGLKRAGGTRSVDLLNRVSAAVFGVLIVEFLLGLTSAQVWAYPVSSQAPPESADSSTVSTPEANIFRDINEVGLGLNWNPGEYPSIPEGFATVRYWFSPRFGLEGGVGSGLRQGNSNVTLTSLELEAMGALVERRLTIFW